MEREESLYSLFAKAIRDLKLDNISFEEFKKACSRTMYRNLPCQVESVYENYKDKFFNTISHKQYKEEVCLKKTDSVESILDFCIEQIKSNGLVPDKATIKKETGSTFKSVFSSKEEFTKLLYERCPDIKNYLFNETSFTEEYKSKLFSELDKHNKFIITTAVSNKKVDEEFLSSLEYFAKENNAMILVMTCDDVASRNTVYDINLDRRLKNHWVIFETDIFLNKNICLSKIKTSAKQINPTTGLKRLVGKLDASIVMASPKQELEYIPNALDKIPMALMTTGAVTEGNYDTDKYMSKRTSVLAESDHKLGAVIVEIQDDHIFHFRQLQASGTGSIVDLGVEYNPNGTKEFVKEMGIVLGDSHVDMHDSLLFDSISNMLMDLPKLSFIVCHDVFNATSVTHHDIGKMTLQAAKSYMGKSSLETEAIELKNYLKYLTSWTDQVVIVKSNHDEHLNRYLEECRFIYDKENFYIAMELCLVMGRDNQDPLKYLIEEKIKFKSDKVKWLSVDESFNMFGVEMGYHGSYGANGAKGNARAFENGLGKCVIGHAHSAKIMRDVYYVGTLSEMDMGYNKGLSSWTRTCCLVYGNGSRQLVNFIPVGDDYSWRVR